MNLEQRLHFIKQNLLDCGGYTIAAKESLGIIEYALRELLLRHFEIVDPTTQDKIRQAEKKTAKGGRGGSIQDFTLGQLLGIIRDSDFLNAWSKAKGKDFLSIRLLNFDELSKLRNPLIHDGAQATPSQALFLYQSLQLLIESFGIESLEDSSLSDLDSLPPLVKLDNPYRGLEAFQTQHAAQFFGRDAAIADLQQLVTQRRLVAVIGNSGSGKSSLVLAGLLPRLHDWQILPCRPRDRALYQLAAALIDGLYQQQINQVARLSEIEQLSTDLPARPALAQALVQRIQDQTGAHLLLVIDQFEELYTNNPPATQTAVLDSLLTLLDLSQGFCLLITLRADFLGAALNHPRLAAWLDADRHKLLGTLDADGLQAAITRPLEDQRLRFEEGLPQRMIGELGDSPAQLPLLQFTLKQLWEQRSGELLTLRSYEALGGVSHALAHHADSIYQGLSDEGKTALRRLFIQLIQPGEGTEDTRKVAALSQFSDPAQQRIIQFLADERLLVTGENSVEVAHEALIRHWQPVREWMKDDRPFRVWQEGLQRDLKDKALLSGARLSTAQEWLDKRESEITADERTFIQHSAEKVAQALAQALAEKHLAQALAEKHRNQRRWVVFSIAFFVVALGLSGMAAWFWQASEQNAQIASENEQRATQKAQEAAENAELAKQNQQDAEEKFTQSLINQSLMLAGLAEIELNKGNQNTAMRLALEALPNTSESHPQRPFVAPAYDFLSRGMNRQYQGILQHDDEVEGAVFSPDGTRLLTYAGKLAYVWDATTRQFIAILNGHEESVLSASFSPDGRRIVTASHDNTARLWEADSGKPLATLRHEDNVNSASFSPDGERIVTASLDKTARLWEADSGKPLATLRHEDNVNSASFSPDGERIVTASLDKTARLWEADSGNHLAALRHEGYVNSASLSPDGRRIVTISDTARLWAADSGKPLATLKGHEKTVISAAFSADGRRIVTASFDHTARLWEADSGKPLATLKGHEDTVRSASFSPDGERIVTASNDNTARLWEADSGKPLATLRHENEVNSASFSPDGRRIVTTSYDNTARLWDGQGQVLAMLHGHEAAIASASFSPDGTRIVTASGDKTTRLWDGQGQVLAVLRGHEDKVNSASFSPDGTRIVTASMDKTAQLWDAQGQPLVVFRGHKDTVWSATFSPDGTPIVTASDDNTARLWDLQGNELAVLRVDDNTVRLWDAQGQALAVLRGHESIATSVSFSPDGTRIVTASMDKTARLWDAQGQELVVLRGHEAEVTSASFSPDSTRIVTASMDKTARLWDAQGQELVVLRGHEDWVSAAAFSPDGTRIITTSWDNIARLWDAQGQALAVLRGYEDFAKSTSFSPDGTHIVHEQQRNYDIINPLTGEEIPITTHNKGWDKIAFLDVGEKTVSDAVDRAFNSPMRNNISEATFSPNGTHIITALNLTEEEVLRGTRYDPFNGEELKTLKTTFSPDGRRIITASSDHTARIWLTFPTVEEMITHAKTFLPPRDLSGEDKAPKLLPGHLLTCAERARFFLEEVERCRAD